MSRPKPTVLLTISNKDTYKQEEVLAAEGIWAVFYDGKPINLKSSSLVSQEEVVEVLGKRRARKIN